MSHCLVAPGELRCWLGQLCCPLLLHACTPTSTCTSLLQGPDTELVRCTKSSHSKSSHLVGSCGLGRAWPCAAGSWGLAALLPSPPTHRHCSLLTLAQYTLNKLLWTWGVFLASHKGRVNHPALLHAARLAVKLFAASFGPPG